LGPLDCPPQAADLSATNVLPTLRRSLQVNADGTVIAQPVLIDVDIPDPTFTSPCACSHAESDLAPIVARNI
jgi:hypothetical protein